MLSVLTKKSFHLGAYTPAASLIQFHAFHSTTVNNTKKDILGLSKEISLKGKKVLVRADLNVPLKKKDPSTITDDTRIRASLPTLNHLIKEGAKIILCSHLGRPDGKVNNAMRLDPVALRLSELLKKKVIKANDCIGDDVKAKVASLKDGDVLLLENVRFHGEEEDNDSAFAKNLTSTAEIFVNDAFGTAHRAHASTEGVTKFVKHSVAGFLLEKELKYLMGAVEKPKRPLAAVIGGAKVSTKLPILESLIDKCDTILLGGGMIFTFYKAQGLKVGGSIVEEDKVELAKKLMEKAKKKGVKLILPTDVVIADKFEADAASKIVNVNSIPDKWLGLDIGPKTQAMFASELAKCKTIVWNGPMGVFEFQKFADGTLGIAKTLAKLTDKGATTIIGGGDSVAAVEQSGLASKMSHISTGGGASLELLEGKVLPGVAALDEAKK